MDLVTTFYNLISPDFFIYSALIFFISFALWEIPRSFKLLPDYTKGIYPDNGRLIDIGLFSLGVIFIALLFFFGRLYTAINVMHQAEIILLFTVLIIFLPLVILGRFLKRFIARFDQHNSVRVFLVHTILDLFRHIFFISLVFLGLGVAASLL